MYSVQAIEQKQNK